MSCGCHPTQYQNYDGTTPRIASVLTPLNDENLQLAAQIGITDIVYYDMSSMPSTAEELLDVRRKCESYGLRLSAVEGGPPMDLIVQGKPGRDAQIEHYKKCITAMGEAGIPVLCYNFMPWSFRVGRTSYEKPIRGGALSSEWNPEEFDDSVRTEEGETSEEEMWRNFDYFLKAVVPVAEKAGVYLACHPDDPPVRRLRGLARILHSPEAFERMLKIVDSPHNGITFCQGCFSEMGVDVPATIRRLGHRTHFVHFRDVVGTAEKGFVETFQDEGQTDMKAALEAWRDVNFNGIVRPDHVPLLPTLERGHQAGEKARGYYSGKASGYTMMGRLFAVGYMRGLWHAVYGREQGSAKAQALTIRARPATAAEMEAKRARKTAKREVRAAAKAASAAAKTAAANASGSSSPSTTISDGLAAAAAKSAKAAGNGDAAANEDPSPKRSTRQKSK